MGGADFYKELAITNSQISDDIKMGQVSVKPLLCSSGGTYRWIYNMARALCWCMVYPNYGKVTFTPELQKIYAWSHPLSFGFKISKDLQNAS